MANKTDRAKALIVDWDVIAQCETERIYELTDGQIAALIGIAQSLYWEKRYLNLPDKQTAIDFANDTIARLTMPIDFCQILNDCGVFDALNAIQESVENLSTSVHNNTHTMNNIETSTGNSAAKPPTPITFSNNDYICGGALALVDYMHAKNMQAYAQAEASVFDNASEAIIGVLAAIPQLEALPVAALGALSQEYFDNQVENYQTDFALARIPMASYLACLIEANDGTINYDVWGDWLDSVEAEVPANTAAQLFAKYAPARQTLANQIAALINSEISLQSYFNELFAAYSAGQDNPSSSCAACGWEQIEDFTAGMQGWTILQSSQTVYTNGVGFQTDASAFGQILIRKSFTAKAFPSMHVRLEFETVAGQIAAGNRYHSDYLAGNIVQSNNFDQLTNTTGEQVREFDVSAIASIDAIEIGAGARNNGSGTITLKRAIYSGSSGTNPFT